MNGIIGQSADNQVDCLAGLGQALGDNDEHRWRMQDGYALASRSGLLKISDKLAAVDEPARNALRGKLRIGLQRDTQVTLGDASHRITQAYCSDLPVSYSQHPPALWSSFARLVLEAAYEATFAAAIVNQAHTGNESLFLTLLGGGAFGNDEDWILAAMRRSLELFTDVELHVVINSYGSSNPGVQTLVHAW